MKLDLRRPGAWAVIVLLLTAAVPPTMAQTPVRGGHFRRALSSDPATLDPAGTRLVRQDAVRMNIFDTLLDVDPRTLRFTPRAAESWSVSVDGRTFTFTLRRGIRFHHGREMTADDVKYSIERILAPETASPQVRGYDRIVGAQEFIARQAREVSGIRVLDRYRLAITITQPDPNFIWNFAGAFGLYIVPREEAERLGRDFGQRPVGSGPFLFVSWQKDTSILLRANNDYWGGRPYISALEFRIIPDPATAQAEFDTGRLEFMLLSDVNYRRYAEDPRWQPYVIEVAELFTRHVGFNVTRPPLNDVRVRQALNYAVDKAALVRTVLGNKAFPPTGVFPPSHPAYNRNLRGYEYNPQRARELLAQAGFPNGFDLELNGSTSPTVGRWMEGIQRYWNDVGVRTRIQQQDFGVVLDRAGKGEIPTYVLSHGGTPNCVGYLGPFRSRNFGPAGNRMFYKNDRVDQLLDQAERAAAGSPLQIRLCQQAEELIVQDAPWFFFNYNKAVLVHQPNVHGLVGNPMEMDVQDMTRVWIGGR
ncbi:MAG: ABC transporter substrate-binding protein [Armatimonadota bacterium]|nr:ABC transporter substrate-binding protein [Armatimonadota bacterium]MDR7450741.1 ABC transporter substrate-binding protein [Armatimonadota bacterium]MDR7466097.1 ABC transporter substrate-binding protein [Armatimonadota bacterium]MDR7493866.1 ABC transporter substrate-binding protein [Armatimonadota bacterium]MDR7498973.1 ABC transporter substrate-binding protein [Armatimonadota bacterium]